MSSRQIMDAQARQLLATASVIAEAKSQKLQGKTSHGKAEAVGPQSAGTPVYDELLRILSTPLSEAKLEEAERKVREAKRQAPKALSAIEQDFWMLEGAIGKDYRQVAEELGVEPQTVWQARKNAKPYSYDPRKGWRLEDKAA